METIPSPLQEKLNRYIDGDMSDTEEKLFETEIRNNPALKNKLDDLVAVDQALKLSKFEIPSKNFTQVVMGKLDHYPGYATTPSMKNGIFLLLGVLVAVAITAMLVSGGVFDSASTSLDLSQIPVPSNLIEKSLPTVSISGKLLVNIIIVVNMVLGWLVLDRTILKPLFQRRLSQQR